LRHSTQPFPLGATSRMVSRCVQVSAMRPVWQAGQPVQSLGKSRRAAARSAYGARREVLMHQIFLFERFAVVVGPWFEPGPRPERGARVEVRLRRDEPHRGSESAAQRLVVDEPLFRADLFDVVDEPPGNLRAAHFHSGFDGVEPRDRLWPEALARDPRAWLRAELGDLVALLVRAGFDADDAATMRDAASIRAALDAVEQAVEGAWAEARPEPA